jgi:aldehyde dehydrogenase (NAD+)
MTEEIFGPILPVVTYDSLDEAIAIITGRSKPLALYVFSSDAAAVERVLAETSAGGVCVNNVVVHVGSPELPFGGVGDSGMGRYHGRAGFDAMSNPKAVLRSPTRPDLPVLYPPYARWKEKLLRRVAG